MSSATQLYLTTLVVYLLIDAMAAWGLNLQFGTAGLLNFGFIVYQAAGAYTVAILSIGSPASNGGFQHYVGGWRLPFPLPLIAAVAVGVVLSLVIGLIGLRRLRSDYQAVIMLVVSLIAADIATAQIGLVNGPAGLSGIPQPFAGLGLSPDAYNWLFAGMCAVACAGVYVLVRGVEESPFGRALRALRDNEAAARALGENVDRLRLTAFAIGGGIAALSGGLFAEYLTSWAPASWTYAETFVFFTAIIVGGVASRRGVFLGTLLVPVALQEAVTYLPQIGRVGLIAALQWVIVGTVTILFVWFRPRGLLPEKRHEYPRQVLRQDDAS
jgi:branched-chain amino acid transport system permease protein